MGKVCFSKCFRYACLAAVTLAAAFLAATAFANTASAAGETGRENASPLKEWDTDNLAAGGIGAKNYRIPFHDYSGERDKVTAKPCVSYNVYAGVGHPVLVAANYDGECQTGRSLVRFVCEYSYRRYVQGSPVPAVLYRPVWLDQYGTRFCGNQQVNDSYAVPCSLYGSNGLCVLVGDPIPAPKTLFGMVSAAPSGLRLCGRMNSTGTVVPSLDSLYTQCPSNLSEAQASRLAHQGCQSAVADAFFQTGGNTGAVNDFPVLEYGSEETAATVTGTGERDSGCADFAKQQDRLVTSMGSNGGWYLDSEGNLRKNAGEVPSRVLARPAATYGTWAAKGPDYYYLGRYGGPTNTAFRNNALSGIYSVLAAADSNYDGRADPGRDSLAMSSGLTAARIHPWNTATRPGGSGYIVSCQRAGTTTTIAGCFDITDREASTIPELLRIPSRFAVAANTNLKYYTQNLAFNYYTSSNVAIAPRLNSRLVHLSAA